MFNEDYKEWTCLKCGHEVLATQRPLPIFWDDGHTCTFTLKEKPVEDTEDCDV